MNFLRQGFRKLSSDRETDRQTDIQTDTIKIRYHAASRVVSKYLHLNPGMSLCHRIYWLQTIHVVVLRVTKRFEYRIRIFSGHLSRVTSQDMTDGRAESTMRNEADQW